MINALEDNDQRIDSCDVGFKDESATANNDASTLLSFLLRSPQLTTSVLHQELENLSEGPRNLLQEAVGSFAQSSSTQSEETIRARLILRVTLRFLLESYRKNEIPRSSIRPTLDRVVQEVDALQKPGKSQLKDAGPTNGELVEELFWTMAQKSEGLTAAEIWCVPPGHVRWCVEESLRQNDHSLAWAILGNYASGLRIDDPIVRKAVAIGLRGLADLYALGDASSLELAVRCAGLQLSVERDPELQGLISSLFVDIARGAFDRHQYQAILQVVNSMDGVETQRPLFAESVWPQLDLATRVHDLVDDAVSSTPKEADYLISVIERFPHPASERFTSRFNQSLGGPQVESVVSAARAAGSAVMACLRENLRARPPEEAAEAVGLLSRLDSSIVEQWLGSHLSYWPQISQDRALRLLATGGAETRGSIILSIFDQLDGMLKPLALDEIGMSGELIATDRLLRLAVGNSSDQCGDFVKLKAIEALGRLRAGQALEPLRRIVESKTLWRWSYPDELRLTAFHALSYIAPTWVKGFFPHSGFTADEMKISPQQASSGSPWSRQRRYPRVSLTVPLPATITSARETIALSIYALSLSGGLSRGEKCLPFGTPVSIRLGPGVRPIRANAFTRAAHGQTLTFEFVNMDLEDRARLRRLICENLP
jgi:hypothetical protein